MQSNKKKKRKGKRKRKLKLKKFNFQNRRFFFFFFTNFTLQKICLKNRKTLQNFRKILLKKRKKKDKKNKTNEDANLTSFNDHQRTPQSKSNPMRVSICAEL